MHYPKDIIRKAAAGATKSGNVRDIIYYVWDDLLVLSKWDMALSENGAVPSKRPFWHGNFRRENDPLSTGFRGTRFSDKSIQPT